jgi:hypothetical protein
MLHGNKAFLVTVLSCISTSALIRFLCHAVSVKQDCRAKFANMFPSAALHCTLLFINFATTYRCLPCTCVLHSVNQPPHCKGKGKRELTMPWGGSGTRTTSFLFPRGSLNLIAKTNFNLTLTLVPCRWKQQGPSKHSYLRTNYTMSHTGQQLSSACLYL